MPTHGVIVEAGEAGNKLAAMEHHGFKRLLPHPFVSQGSRALSSGNQLTEDRGRVNELDPDIVQEGGGWTQIQPLDDPRDASGTFDGS